MRRWLLIQGVAALAALVSSGSVRAQEVLLIQPSTFEFGVMGAALDELDLAYTIARSPDQIEAALAAQAWDLIIIRSKNRSPFSPTVLPELEAHVARGGALHVQVADLQNASARVYELLGLEGAVDLSLPLSDIELAPPRHPSVSSGGFLALWEESYPPDFGDALTPAQSSTGTQRYRDDGRFSTVLSRGGRVLVNGQQWDNWNPVSGVFMATHQFRWLLRCPADLNLDGTLDIADFLLFQNMFDRGDPSADFDMDGRLTIFDFLQFANAFEAGCR